MAGVALIKATRTDVGRTVVVTIAGFLCILLASPLYDVYSLHSQKEKSDSAETLMSETRRYDNSFCTKEYCSVINFCGNACSLVFLGIHDLASRPYLPPDDTVL